MDKKVVLKLDGIIEHGCRVVLEIWSEQDLCLEAIGSLPPNPELAHCATTHWANYRSLGDPARNSRLTPEEIITDGSLSRTQKCRKSAREMKDRFRRWLDSEDFRSLERCLLNELNTDDSIRVGIRTNDPQLQKLPWHLWGWIESRSVEVELRFLPNPCLLLTPPEECGSKVRILAILGHSQGINVEADQQLLENLPDADVLFLVEPKLKDLSEILWEQSWDILFFAGHSETEGDRGRIYLNGDDSLTLDELWFSLSKAVKRGLQLAIFNSCDGLGLAQQLGDLQLPQMVVMREVVSDRVAQAFLKYFLNAFAQGQPFAKAVRQAREQLEGWEKECPCASWLPAIVTHPNAPPLSWGPGLQPPSNPVAPTPKPPPWNWKNVLAASMAMAGVTLGIRSLGLLQTWELPAFDRLVQLQPDEPLDPRIAIVTITEEDIQAQNPEARQGSLSNETLDRLLQKLNAHQPRVIGLDIYRPFPLGEQYRRLANQFQNNENFIVVCEVGGGKENPPIPPPPDIPLTRVGFSDAPIDPDGIIRRQFFGMSPGKDCATDVSFSFAIAQQYLSAEGIEFLRTSPNSFQIGTANFPKVQPNTGGYHQLDSGGYQVMLNYRSGGAPAQTVTLGEILDDGFDPALIRDRIILIGTTASSIEDGLPTPYSAKYSPTKTIPGIFIQAQAVSQILSAVKDNRPVLRSLPEWGEFLCIWMGAIAPEVIFIWGCSGKRDFTAYFVMGMGGLVLIGGIGYLALIQGVWISIVPVGLAFMMASARRIVGNSGGFSE
ncbi:MAG: CHASE2 domain-containing protein [Geitlerinemataceae cyanobacterium]